jgi:hypothetical protein
LAEMEAEKAAEQKKPIINREFRVTCKNLC